MVKVIDKINDHISKTSSKFVQESQKPSPFFSLEFFPPKTEEGKENLYLRMERMIGQQPIFIDITWGAGGSTKELTMSICEYAQLYLGVDTIMHLTLTGMTEIELKSILNQAKDAGIQNILALRGDPPKGAMNWEPIRGGFNNAIDLVKLIRREFNDYFCIAVSGFPEGHPSSKLDLDTELKYLKEKVDAGADFILTQFFYDTKVFIEFVERCRAFGISCPIIPGMLPIQSYSSFERMTSFCKSKVPDKIWEDIAPFREDDDAIKAYGVKLCTEMCEELLEKGSPGFHFYTLNLEKSVLSVIKELGIEELTSTRKAFPWRGSRCNLNGMVEDVRPINWANRPKSYIQRTVTWDEFPNGRWGDSRSPAFGDLSHTHAFFRGFIGTKEERLSMWGEAPINVLEIGDVFAKYIEGKIPVLPWCESSLQAETSRISTVLTSICRKGLFTINSQPAVNGEKSDHQVFGWGGPGGRVYQKAYIEFFCSKPILEKLIEKCKSKHSSISLYAINVEGDEKCITSSNSKKGVTALTWGVFPEMEIMQPTIFDRNSFAVWSKEAFQLWIDSWASLYDDESPSAELIYNIFDTYYLVALVDNDFINPTILDIFTSEF